MVGSITDTQQPLVSLKSTDLAVTQSENVLGYAVHDSDNVKIGEVDDLVVDRHSGRVRFLVVGDGGLLGIGRHHSLVPVDIVSEIVSESAAPTIFLGVAEVIVDASPWDGRIDTASFAASYRYFDCTPYWADDYVERDWSATPASG